MHCSEVKQWYGATVWSSVMRETWACAWLIVEIREAKQWYGAPGDGMVQQRCGLL